MTRAGAIVLGLAAAAAGISAAESPGRIRIGKPHRLKVTHTTRVRIEEGTAKLEVWHAQPLKREWPGLKAPLGVEKVAFVPSGSKEAPTRTEGGLAWEWELTAPSAGVTDYVSTFEVLSADRDLKTSGLEIHWADLPKDTTELMKGLPALPTPNERVREAFAQIRKKAKDVIDAITAFALWINTNIAYTPGVTYPIDDLDAICRGGGGHCAHRATVFLAFCQAAGIPARRVIGYVPAVATIESNYAPIGACNRFVDRTSHTDAPMGARRPQMDTALYSIRVDLFGSGRLRLKSLVWLGFSDDAGTKRLFEEELADVAGGHFLDRHLLVAGPRSVRIKSLEFESEGTDGKVTSLFLNDKKALELRTAPSQAEVWVALETRIIGETSNGQTRLFADTHHYPSDGTILHAKGELTAAAISRR